eukprot:1012014-Pleurochrysis_carterae.AAC.1
MLGTRSGTLGAARDSPDVVPVRAPARPQSRRAFDQIVSVWCGTDRASDTTPDATPVCAPAHFRSRRAFGRIVGVRRVT